MRYKVQNESTAIALVQFWKTKGVVCDIDRSSAPHFIEVVTKAQTVQEDDIGTWWRDLSDAVVFGRMSTVN